LNNNFSNFSASSPSRANAALISVIIFSFWSNSISNSAILFLFTSLSFRINDKAHGNFDAGSVSLYCSGLGIKLAINSAKLPVTASFSLINLNFSFCSSINCQFISFIIVQRSSVFCHITPTV